MERNDELEAYNKMLFYLIKDQTEQRERLEKEIERLSVVIDEKQQKIDYYEGTYFTIEAAAKERMAIIQQQQAQLEKYRKESVFRPLRKIKSLFQKEKECCRIRIFLIYIRKKSGRDLIGAAGSRGTGITGR